MPNPGDIRVRKGTVGSGLGGGANGEEEDSRSEGGHQSDKEVNRVRRRRLGSGTAGLEVENWIRRWTADPYIGTVLQCPFQSPNQYCQQEETNYVK